MRGTLPPIFVRSSDSNHPLALPKTAPVTCTCATALYDVGDRVAAAVNNPQSAPGILAGHLGTVICGTQFGFPTLLISWDGWTSGHDGNGFCDCPGVSLPDNSGWFVDCPDVVPATAQPVDCVCSSQFYVGSRVTAAVDNPAGAANLFTGHPGTVVCGSSGSPPLLVAWDNWIDGHNSNGFCNCPDTTLADSDAWYVNCADVNIQSQVNCQCGGAFTAGQRVEALVDNPYGAPGILTGHQGTVVCGSSTFANEILISWDGWTSGHNGNGFCGCPVASLPDTSGWWVHCTDIGGCPDDYFETSGYYGTDDLCWGAGMGSPSATNHLHCDEDWIYVWVTAGVTYTFRTENLIGGADTVIELYDTCATFLTSDDDGGGGFSSLLSVPCTTSSWWSLKTREFSDSYMDGEGYTLKVTDSTVLFYDGFEISTTADWGAVVP